MKRLTYILAAWSIMMLGACSSENELTVKNEPPIVGDGFMTVKLGFIGADDISRVGDSQQFDDGTETESEIHNITAYYFDEGNNYLGSGDGTINSQATDDSDNNIERTADVTLSANVVSYIADDSKTAKVIVVLNKPASFSTTLTTSNTYADFNAAYAPGTDNAGFMMTNVNYVSTPSSPTENYFATITSTNVYKEGSDVSLDGTNTPTPVTIYVERVCGKVTLTTASMTQPTDAAVEVKKWGLNVRNTKVYPVKVLQTGSDAYPTWATYGYFNLPGTKTDNTTHYSWTDPSKYRSYWAVDPNYNADDYLNTDFTIINFDDLDASSGEVRYCLENTFAASHQDRDETTTAVVLATFKPQGQTGTWVIYEDQYRSKDDFIDQFLKDNAIYTDNSGSNVATKDDVKFDIQSGTEVKWENETIGGTYTLAAAEGQKLYQKSGGTYSEITDWSTISTQLQQSAQIYTNGYCYYEIPIRHFTNAEVPLNEDDINGEDQLGRYGIVRNHYYQLTIKKISKEGKPIKEDPITPDQNPDDPTTKYYLDADIKVLSWAVRTQDVEL